MSKEPITMMYSLFDRLTGEAKPRTLGLFHLEQCDTPLRTGSIGMCVEHVEDRLKHGVVPCVYVQLFGYMLTVKIGRMRKCPGVKE